MVLEEYLGEQKAGNGFLTRISSPPRDACNSGPREGFPSHNQLPRRALNKDQKRKLHNNPKGFHGLQGSYRDDDKIETGCARVFFKAYSLSYMREDNYS